MKRVLFTAVLISVFMGGTVITSLAASEHEAHHPARTQSAATSSKQGMMSSQGMTQMPCMAAAEAGSMSQLIGMMGQGMGDMMGAGMGKMMSVGKKRMMGQRMAHMFYLNRADELGLSADQFRKLKTLHMECRKENIRNTAEAKIARLDLADLLDGDNWSLKDAESLIRKVQKLEGDIQVRHLQAVSDARQVLTAEQLKQAHADDSAGNLESLFQ